MKEKKVLLLMFIINFISIISGFIRDSSIAISLGATSIADIFIFTINLPTLIFSSIGWVIMSSFLPTYTDVMVKQGDDKANTFSNTFIKIVISFVTGLMILFIVGRKWFIKILAPGFSGENFILTEQLFVIIIPSLLFLSISSCFAAILNASKKMVWVSLLGIPVNITIILSILFIYPKLGIKYATFVVMLGSILQMLIMKYPLSKTKFKLTKDFNINDKNIKTMLVMIGPMIIGVMAQQINSLFSGAITSTLVEGNLTAYNLANKIVNAVYNCIILIGISYIYPYISEYYSSNRIKKFNDTISRCIQITIAVLIPLSTMIIILNNDIISILFGYGKFTAEAVSITSEILVVGSIGIVFLGIREFLNRSYYCMKNTKVPMQCSILGIVINIVLGYILAKKIGVLGVVFANTLSLFISCAAITRRFIKDNDVNIINKKEAIKYTCIFVTLNLISKIFRGYFNVNFYINIVVVSIFIVIAYIILLKIYNVEILSMINLEKIKSYISIRKKEEIE